MTQNNAENAAKYICKLCDFKCSKKSNFDKHLLTRKHINNDNILKTDDNKMPKRYMCKCGKEYVYRQGLYIHKKKCDDNETNIIEPNIIEPNIIESIITDANIIDSSIESNIIDNNILDTNELPDIIYNIFLKEKFDFKNLILEVVKNNSELQKQTCELQKQTCELQKANQELHKQVLDVCKNNGSNSSNSNNTINSHNKNFNLNFFLNEQCKDAMNIMDFVNTFQLQLSDLEHIGEVGYVEGISNIVIDKLNQMDIYKRPIHCSDAKREIMHVKDKDVWEKDTPTNAKIRLALKHITKKNTDLLRPWVNAHPGVLDSEHRLNDKYQQLFIEAMGGNSGTLTECETKIIKKISKMVLIDKSNGNKSN